MDYTNKSNIYLSYEWANDIKEIANQLKRIADVLEREKVKHGHWETEVITDCLGNKHCCFACSCCGMSSDYEYDHCPHCGAKMNEERIEDEIG